VCDRWPIHSWGYVVPDRSDKCGARPYRRPIVRAIVDQSQLHFSARREEDSNKVRARTVAQRCINSVRVVIPSNIPSSGALVHSQNWMYRCGHAFATSSITVAAHCGYPYGLDVGPIKPVAFRSGNAGTDLSIVPLLPCLHFDPASSTFPERAPSCALVSRSSATGAGRRISPPPSIRRLVFLKSCLKSARNEW
jgi:hypothetical protein